MAELTKRLGNQEYLDEMKLARSIRLAGVLDYYVSSVVARVSRRPVPDTATLRARVERELAEHYPIAARQYAFTRSLETADSGEIDSSWAELHPATADRLGLRPGAPIWVERGYSTLRLSTAVSVNVKPGRVRLNATDLARAGICRGARIAVSRFSRPELVTEGLPGLPGSFRGIAPADEPQERPDLVLGMCAPDARPMEVAR